MGKDGVLTTSALIDGDGAHLCHGVVDTFRTAMGLWVGRTSSGYVDAQQVLDGGGGIGRDLKAVDGDVGDRSSQ